VLIITVYLVQIQLIVSNAKMVLLCLTIKLVVNKKIIKLLFFSNKLNFQGSSEGEYYDTT